MEKSHLILVFTLIMLFAMSTGLVSADQVVDNTNDSGAGSLRQAIIDVGAGEEITFSVTGTITLTTGQLSIDKNLTINGPDADQLSIDGNANSRIFLIGTSSTNPTVTIMNLTIKNGNDSGGGIYNFSDNLTLENCIISGNSGVSGGGIYNYGRSGCTASPTLIYCTISGNSSTYGGGIYNDGLLGNSSSTLINCTLSNNSASDEGDAMYNTGLGGICNPILTNCIIWGEVYNLSAAPSYSYCNTSDGIMTGTGNISSNPLFVDSLNSDYHLTEDSPCIDAGDPGSPLDPDCTIADMGAYYYHQIIVPDSPQNVTIEISGTDIHLSWNAVMCANSYKVYSSDDPYNGFEEDTSGSFVEESWSAPIGDLKKFYHVKAINN